MPDEALTKKEYEILTYITNYHNKHGYMPSIREICDGVNVKSTSTVHYHLTEMFIKGVLETEAPLGAPRAFRVANQYL